MGHDPDDAENWWQDVECDVLGCLNGQGPVSVDALAQRLAMPEPAVASLVAMLARDGKLRIRLVEAIEDNEAA